MLKLTEEVAVPHDHKMQAARLNSATHEVFVSAVLQTLTIEVTTDFSSSGSGTNGTLTMNNER